MEAFRCAPIVSAPCRHCRLAVGTWTVHDQGQSAGRREADASPALRGSYIHGYFRVFYIGLGNEFDADKLETYPPGAMIVLPGNTSHFQWAKSGEYIAQVTAIGPLGFEYVNSKDDPRNANSQR